MTWQSKLWKEKKGFKYHEFWPELFFVVFLILSFLISVFLPSKVMSYIVIFILAIGCGRYIQFRKRGFPYFLIVVGLLIGYLLGNLLGNRYGNWRTILFLFIFGTVLSYYLHERGYMK
ncbi:hypothetical protein HYS48_02550 [Candidatus Woesearchaeota archaeon]|nr:hypothetical protein [Candidatus Woesearchaeota archaeon]